MTKKELFLSMLPPEVMLAALCNESEVDHTCCFLGLLECPFTNVKCYEVSKKHWKELFDRWDKNDAS